MYMRINVLAAGLTLAAGALLHPAPANATYLPTLTADTGGGVVYCCNTRPNAQCCFSSGCTTRDGRCRQVSR